MNNAISMIRNDMQRHKVTVTLPNEQEEKQLFLTIMEAKTSQFEDFKQTYGKQVTTTHLKLAEKVFGKGETENTYGVFYDKNLQIVFAFNRDFADYDSSKKQVLFKDIDDLLIERVQAKEVWKKKEKKKLDLHLPSIPRRPRRPVIHDSGFNPHTIIKYSLTEKQ
jgi:hypothetical protein